LNSHSHPLLELDPCECRTRQVAITEEGVYV
jgi:hypothetical protein